MTKQVPPNDRTYGDSGHLDDHTDISDMLGMLNREINVKQYPYNAVGDGTTDDSSAFQDALDDLATAGGGRLIIPTGNYKIVTGLTWTSSNSLWITGDGIFNTKIHMWGAAAPWYCLSITNCNRLIMEGISFLTDVDPSTYSGQYVAIRLSYIDWASFRYVHTATSTQRRVNQSVVADHCTDMDFDCCDLRSFVNNLRLSTGVANVAIRSSQLFMNTGSGVSSAANVWCDDTMQTLRMIGCTTNSGERGVYWSEGTGAQPAFGFFYDVEVNNSTDAGFQFDTGAEVWASQCWLATNQGGSYTARAVHFGSSYDGIGYFSQCTFGGYSHHSVQLEGGDGFAFTDNIFSGSKAASNTYDHLNIGASVDQVSVVGNHFDVDAYAGFGATHPRSAINIANGPANVVLVGNITQSSGYGTGALIDSGTVAVKAANIGFS